MPASDVVLIISAVTLAITTIIGSAVAGFIAIKAQQAHIATLEARLEKLAPGSAVIDDDSA